MFTTHELNSLDERLAKGSNLRLGYSTSAGMVASSPSYAQERQQACKALCSLTQTPLVEGPADALLHVSPSLELFLWVVFLALQMIFDGVNTGKIHAVLTTSAEQDATVCTKILLELFRSFYC